MARRKVFLIGWDAADWKVINPLMDSGKMPHLRRFIETGAMGQISTLHPPLSPMLWTSIATGKRPFKHGIHGFSEPTPNGLGVQPVTNLSRKSKALWNILNQEGLRSVVVGWWPSHPAEPIRGVMVSDHYHRAIGPLDNGWPLLKNAVHPPDLADTLADLRMHPDLLTPGMIEPFIPLALEIDQDKDNRLAGCMKILCECVSIHSAATWLLDNEQWDFFAVYYDAIDHFCHGFMKYHPPRQAWITERDFELYGNVVSMAYQFHDQMLGTLLSKLGDDVVTILLSDHGFHPDHLRPAAIPNIPAGPAIEHRDFGIFAMSGPGIKQDELLHGLSVLDIAPTVLTLFGLAVGEDMDGKVLTQAFIAPPELTSIPSWEDVPGEDGAHPPHTRLDPVAAHEAMEQMIALGYIERPDEDHELAVENTIRELRYNLGESFQDDGRHQEAYEIFRELRTKDCDEQRFAVRLFVSCQALGRTREMREIVDDLDTRRRALFVEAGVKIVELQETRDPPRDDNHNIEVGEIKKKELARWRNLMRYQPPVIDYLKAQVLASEKRYEEALDALGGVMAAHVARPGLFIQTGDLYLRLRRWKSAEEVYHKALSIDPDNAHAHLGLCRVALRRRHFTEAAQSALEALQRIYNFPPAHYFLALALTGMCDYTRAAEALKAAISFNPNFPEAHLRLAALLEKHLGDAESALAHRRLAQRMRRGTPDRPLFSMPERVEISAAASTRSSDMEGQLATQPLSESLVVVTGLPRSGTSLIMQMVAAGGIEVLTDGLREPDEDNPRGYVEYEPVKNLLRDSAWLRDAKGKAVKIVAPLLPTLPVDLPCWVIFSERDLEEILDSQNRMLVRRGQILPNSPNRRTLLRKEYNRISDRVKAMLRDRPGTRVLMMSYGDVLESPTKSAEKLNAFLGGGFDVLKMTAAVDPLLHRNRVQNGRNAPTPTPTLPPSKG